MSAVRKDASHEDDYALADLVLRDVRARGLPVAPRHYEFWLKYGQARDIEFHAAADEIAARRGGRDNLRIEDIESLYCSHLSPWRFAGDRDRLTDSYADQLRGLSDVLDDAIGSIAAQSEVLRAGARALDTGEQASFQSVLGVIDQLLETARGEQARAAILEARLSAVNQQVGVLQKQLVAVRHTCEADPVTGLIGRVGFDRALQAAVLDGRRIGRPPALVLCDLDYFESFLEVFGPRSGDHILRLAGLLLKSHARANDVVARLDRDLFAVLLPQAEAADALQLAEGFRQALMTRELIMRPDGSRSARLTVSVGVAAGEKGDTAAALRERADSGLAMAKSEGRNRVVEMTLDGAAWTPKRRA